MEQLTVRWHGHACFSLTCRDFTVVLDPYEDHYVPGFPPLRLTGDLVLCSHQHNDHNAAEIVTLRTGRPNPFRITKIPTFHDPEGGRLRGENTIHLLEVGKLRVAHFGDLGCPLSPAQKAELQGLDAAMVPVGGFYTIVPRRPRPCWTIFGPRSFCPRLPDGRRGPAAVGQVEDFLSLVENYVYYPTDTLSLDEGTKPQIAVLHCSV